MMWSVISALIPENAQPGESCRENFGFFLKGRISAVGSAPSYQRRRISAVVSVLSYQCRGCAWRQ
jgi:hypothetical protein